MFYLRADEPIQIFTDGCLHACYFEVNSAVLVENGCVAADRMIILCFDFQMDGAWHVKWNRLELFQAL